MNATTVLLRNAHAEWLRIRTVRSSWLLAGVTSLAVLGIATLIGIDAAQSPDEVAGASAWAGVRPTAMFALFGALALSVVASTADHTTGAIVPTMQWTPKRWVLFASRAGVVVAVCTVLGVVLYLGAAVIARLLVPQVALPWGEGLDALGSVAFVIATGAGLGVGLGLVLRSMAGGLVSVIALVLVVPPLLAQLPYESTQWVTAHLPGTAALFLLFGDGPSGAVTTGSARVTLLLWAVVALAAGGARLVRTDAAR